MANIQNELNNIKTALYGKDVRGSIHDGIDAINKEVESTTGRQVDLENTFDQLVINAGNSNAEIVDARVKNDGTSYSKLGDRLNEVDSQLEHKAFKNYIDVKEFGAKGDGVTNDTKSIEDCLNYAKENNIHHIMFGKGVFVCNMVIDSHMRITGTGSKTIIKLPPNSKDHCIKLKDNATKFVAIENITIDGNKQNQTIELAGIYLNSTDRKAYYDNEFFNLGDAFINMNNVKIINCSGDGLYLNIRGESIYTNIYSLNNDGNGIYADVFDSSFINISCGQNKKNGLKLYSNNNRIYNFKAWNNGIGNNSLSDGRGIIVTGSYNHIYGECQGNLLEGLRVYDSDCNFINVNVDTSGQRDNISTNGVNGITMVNSKGNIVDFNCNNRPDRNEILISTAIQITDDCVNNKIRGTFKNVNNAITINHINIMNNDIDISGSNIEGNKIRINSLNSANKFNDMITFSALPPGKVLSISKEQINHTLLPENLANGVLTVSNGTQGGRLSAKYVGLDSESNVIVYEGVWNNSTSLFVWRKM